LPAVEPKTRVRSFCSGEQYDTDLSLYYLRARYYNPTTGRFLNVDPLAGQGQRRYEYAGADPVDGSDPSGNFVLASYWPQMAALQVHIPSPKCSQGNGTSMGNSLPPCTPPPPPCKCGLKTPPEYDKGPVIPGGTEFSWRATFLNDSTHKPTCCEVRQMVQWDRGPAPPQFRPPEDQPNTWYEDRDLTDLINSPFDRYGRRGIISSGIEDNNYYDGDDYFGYDQPDRFPHGTTLKFKLIVVDVCNGTKTIYTSKILSDKF
jgi:RHS repeat-associated protein